MNDHYFQNGVDCLDVISDVLDFWQAKGDDAFYLGNVVKYVMRAPYKNDFGGDIDKAIDYLNKLKDNHRVQSGVHFDFGDDVEEPEKEYNVFYSYYFELDGKPIEEVGISVEDALDKVLKDRGLERADVEIIRNVTDFRYIVGFDEVNPLKLKRLK